MAQLLRLLTCYIRAVLIYDALLLKQDQMGSTWVAIQALRHVGKCCYNVSVGIQHQLMQRISI